MVTRTRILDAAERLFAEQGYGASLREITAAAQVNLAAVNYHFGSKEELLVAVVLRRIDAANALRIAALDELELRGEATVEELVEVFLRPALEYAADEQGGGAHFMRLIGRVHGDPDGPWRRVLSSGAFDQVQQRFLAALKLVCPHLTQRDLMWRLHLMVGAMVQTLLHPEALIGMSQGACDPRDPEAALAQLVPFLSAGLSAPPSES